MLIKQGLKQKQRKTTHYPQGFGEEKLGGQHVVWDAVLLA